MVKESEREVVRRGMDQLEVIVEKGRFGEDVTFTKYSNGKMEIAVSKYDYYDMFCRDNTYVTLDLTMDEIRAVRDFFTEMLGE